MTTRLALLFACACAASACGGSAKSGTGGNTPPAPHSYSVQFGPIDVPAGTEHTARRS
jgi:hypothetical protein